MKETDRLKFIESGLMVEKILRDQER